MKIKICGITNTEDALLSESLGTDAIGFIFYEKGKRYVTPETVRDITNVLSPFTIKVGVFVDESSEIINAISKLAGINVVQLHGNEKQDIINSISLPVIKVFRVDNNFDYKMIDQYNGCSILLDTYSEKSYGGTGKQFDWEKIPTKIRNKIILAGGVSLENIEFIYKNINPAAVDLSSSLEIMPGKKNKKKMGIFFKKVNQLRR
ncbi:MAG: phosphoribosylanthranilate isomerase [Ignavibacteria bacterium]|nr:phosphoribosylanthranilate isomerase [Ignavibacteria bacterium]